MESNQNLRSTDGISEQETMEDFCSDGNKKASLVILLILSPLSHKILAKLVCLIWVSWLGLKADGFSYQNLEKNDGYSDLMSIYVWNIHKYRKCNVILQKMDKKKQFQK